MDREERLEAVRERAVALRDHAVSAREAGPPCWKCRFYGVSDRLCGSDLAIGATFDPETRRFKEGGRIAAREMRSDDGLCGPEALLFERHPRAIVEIGTGIGKPVLWFLAACGGIAIADLAGRVISNLP